ncbi:MAG: PIN domain-containing protein [Nanoarchaeota archaeon]|nr:PIN domain-containing protein [Nanoarchaeota archaeon]MBU1631956.1 PIN domain-containing protein [Nanoarchaeota archaeon]MBU1876413.1 PIN domain-containing protein [Nanoarchaeota archaeon]
MDFVVDANVVFAVLIKDSFSYHLLFSEKYHLFTPEYVFTEFQKHKEEILDKTERTTEDFFRLLEILKRRITLVPLEELTEYVEEAEKLSPDPKDMAYFALALKLNCAIWSNDKKLKEQDKVKVYPTHELIKL